MPQLLTLEQFTLSLPRMTGPDGDLAPEGWDGVSAPAQVPYRAPVSVDHPPAEVLRAFGLEGPARPLSGGQGTAWVAEDLVLKPGGGAVHEWLAMALDDVVPVGFRLAAPVRTLHGSWSWEGWVATRWVEGAEPDHRDPSTWPEVIEAGRAFHRAVAHLDRPRCLDSRDDWWAVADRVAWEEHRLQLRPELADQVARLRPALEPLGAPQVVHGDLTGNVLSSPALVPAVIDISPYWRPPQYAEGVVVADALCWHGAPASLLEQTGVPAAAVARALLFRMVTTSQAVSAGQPGVDVEEAARRYAAAATAIGL